jgi:hypothetical protein
VAVVVAIVLLLCAGGVTAGVLAFNAAKDRALEALKPITDPALPTDLPQMPDFPTDQPTDGGGLSDPGATGDTIDVVYEVTGDGPVSIIYTEKLGDPAKRVDDADLPWRLETTMDGGAALISITAIRAATDTGTISCRATVDGREVAHRTREGTFISASCLKMIL